MIIKVAGDTMGNSQERTRRGEVYVRNRKENFGVSRNVKRANSEIQEETPRIVKVNICSEMVEGLCKSIVVVSSRLMDINYVAERLFQEWWSVVKITNMGPLKHLTPLIQRKIQTKH